MSFSLRLEELEQVGYWQEREVTSGDKTGTDKTRAKTLGQQGRRAWARSPRLGQGLPVARGPRPSSDPRLPRRA